MSSLFPFLRPLSSADVLGELLSSRGQDAGHGPGFVGPPGVTPQLLGPGPASSGVVLQRLESQPSSGRAEELLRRLGEQAFWIGVRTSLGLHRQSISQVEQRTSRPSRRLRSPRSGSVAGSNVLEQWRGGTQATSVPRGLGWRLEGRRPFPEPEPQVSGYPSQRGRPPVTPPVIQFGTTRKYRRPEYNLAAAQGRPWATRQSKGGAFSAS